MQCNENAGKISIAISSAVKSQFYAAFFSAVVSVIIFVKKYDVYGEIISLPVYYTSAFFLLVSLLIYILVGLSGITCRCIYVFIINLSGTALTIFTTMSISHLIASICLESLRKNNGEILLCLLMLLALMFVAWHVANPERKFMKKLTSKCALSGKNKIYSIVFVLIILTAIFYLFFFCFSLG